MMLLRSNSIGVSQPSWLWRRAPVVPDFEVVEHRVGQLDPGFPLLSVEQLDLHPRPERLDHRVVVAVPDAAHRRHQPGGLRAVGEGPRPELDALSEWITVPADVVFANLLSIAMPSALVTRAAVGDASIDQPTTRREYVSRTTQQ
jgi:hypothetical protein